VTARAAAVLVAVLGIAPAAEAKLVPRFDPLVAARGERVTVDLGYTEPYRAPLEVFLVRTRDEPHVRSRADRRLSLVGRLRRDGSGSLPSSISFVARVRPGSYTLAVWFRGTATGRWHNATAGRWRGEPRLVLRVVASQRS
jgi:hypothetical protein